MQWDYDFKKTFNSFHHDIFHHKLERYGTRGVVLDWVQSYLNRGVCEVGGLLFFMFGHCFWCPPGVRVGGKAVYIIDICKVSKILKLVLFADDTNIFCSGN